MLRWLRHPLVWLPVSLGLLALVIWRSRLWEAGLILGPVDPRLLVAALIVGQATPVLWAVRSHELLRGTGRDVPIRSLIPMTSFANTINNLTPGSAGELIRLYLLQSHHGVEYATGAAVILIERLGALGYLSLSALLLWLSWLGDWPVLATTALVVVLVFTPLVVYRLGIRPVSPVARLPLGRVLGVARWSRVADSLDRVDATIAALLTRPDRVAGFAVVTAGVFVVSTAQLLLVASSIGVSVPPTAAWGAIGLSTTAGVLSFLPFGLGAADLVLVTLLNVAGVPLVEGGVIAFGYRLVGTVPYALEGIASYAWLSSTLPPGALAEADEARQPDPHSAR
jgi:glycosyltransferase 2 family protein